jgi:predicted aconitase with swiveling domain
MRIKGRIISKGVASGEALICKEPISFLGGVNPKTGIVVEKESPIEGKCIAGKVLIFPRGKGSTVGSYVLFELKRNGLAPAAIINDECEVIIAVGAIISGIPAMDRLEKDIFGLLKDGQTVKVDAVNGFVEVKE